MTLPALIAEIERRYPVWTVLDFDKLRPVESYISIGDQLGIPADLPGTIDAGARRDSYPSEQAAIKRALAAFGAYSYWWHRTHPGEHPTLYWRFPEKAEMTSYRKRHYVYMRLVLSARGFVAVKQAVWPPHPFEGSPTFKAASATA
jgi:hypothetical protein